MATSSAPDSRVLCFGSFEVDLRSAELRKAGVRIALQDKPFRLLTFLLNHPGEVVTRDALQRELWPNDTFVDFERGLNTAVKRLRDALGDDADTPRFVETRPRHGYRFIAPVTMTELPRGHAADAIGARSISAPIRFSFEQPWKWIAIGLATITATVVVFAWIAGNRSVNAPPIARFELSIAPAEQLGPGPGSTTAGGSRTAFALSSDGRTLVFVGTRAGVQQLFVRSLDREAAEPLPLTEGAVEPVLSPDGEWVAFYSANFLRKVRIGGGPPVAICELPQGPPMGMAWSPTGDIVLGRALGPLQEVSGDGGRPVEITQLANGELSHRLPHFLPDGHSILFTIRKRDYTWGDEEIVVQPNRLGPYRKLVIGTDGRYVSSGHLVFLQLGRLMAARFDAGGARVTSSPVSVNEGIAESAAERDTFAASGAGQFATSTTGTLVYVRGGVAARLRSRVVWVDRQGRKTPVSISPDNYAEARLSPDGRRLVLWIWDTTRALIVVHDLERATTTVLPSESEDAWPIWSPDGRDIWYQSYANGQWTLRRRPADGTGVPETLLQSYSVTPVSWSSDGRTLAIVDSPAAVGGGVVRVLGWRRGDQPRPLLQTLADATHPMFSPFGNYLAYSGQGVGRGEVYLVQPGTNAPRLQVSNNGGQSVAWRRDGAELYYVERRQTASSSDRLMAVSVSTVPDLRVGRPQLLFEAPWGLRSSPVNGFDVTGDGQQFLMLIGDEAPPIVPVTHLQVILSWIQELKKNKS